MISPSVRPIEPRPHEWSSVARHLWGIVLSGHDERDIVPDGRDHTVPVGESGSQRDVGNLAEPAAAREVPLRGAIDRASRLIPPGQLVAMVARDTARAFDSSTAAPEVRWIIQPRYRGTAVEIFLATLQITRQDPHAIVIVLPDNHVVDHEARFMSYVARGVEAVSLQPDLPVLIAAHPRSPDASAYGWIEPGDLVEGLEPLSIRSVRQFMSRPSPAEMRALFEGNGLVSTLVLIVRAGRLLELGERYLPEVLETLEPLEDVFGAPEEVLLREAVYECMPYASISAQLLEGGRPFAVLPIPS